MAEAKPGKPKKLLRRLQSLLQLHLSFQAAQVETGLKSAGPNCPKAKAQTFHKTIQEAGQVLSLGWAHQHQQWRINICTCMVWWCDSQRSSLSPAASSDMASSPGTRNEPVIAVPCRGHSLLSCLSQCTPNQGLTIHTGIANRPQPGLRAGGVQDTCRNILALPGPLGHPSGLRSRPPSEGAISKLSGKGLSSPCPTCGSSQEARCWRWSCHF